MRIEVLLKGQGVADKLDTLVGPVVIDSILDDVQAALLQHTRERFLQQLDPDGNAWVPSQAGILREQRGQGFTLFDTGKLFHSIQAFPAGTNERALGTDVESNSGFAYGLALQLGGNGLPARVFLGVGDDDAHSAEVIAQTRVERAIAEVGK